MVQCTTLLTVDFILMNNGYQNCRFGGSTPHPDACSNVGAIWRGGVKISSQKWKRDATAG